MEFLAVRDRCKFHLNGITKVRKARFGGGGFHLYKIHNFFGKNMIRIANGKRGLLISGNGFPRSIFQLPGITTAKFG